MLTYLSICEDKRRAAVGKGQLWCIWGKALGSPSPISKLAQLGVHADKCTVPGLQEIRQFGGTPTKILLLCCESPGLGCQLDNLAFQCLNLCLQDVSKFRGLFLDLQA